MKIALSQKRVFMNNPKKNFEYLKRDIEKAIGKADLVVFGELSLSGALYGERQVNETIIDTLLKYQKEVIALSKEIPIVWGNIFQAQDTYINTLFYAEKGKLVAYAFEDEPLEVKLKNKTLVFSHTTQDTQHLNVLLGMRPYQHDVQTDIFTNTICLGQDGLYNNGHEVYVLDTVGYVSIKDQTQYLNESFQIIDLNHIQSSPYQKPTVLDMLLKGIQYFDEENLSYKPQWIVGVSGGLDSAVSVALLTLALGKERVHGVTMPGPHTRDISLQNAHHLFKKLDITHETVDINAMVEATLSSLNYDTIEGLAYENIQARLRGHTLMSIASLINGVVSNNGNRIEAALGYATLYGDAIGALSLLADLTKLEVGQIAQNINDKMQDEIIPHNLIPNIDAYQVNWGFAPSAELSKDQFDPMKWGYHDHLVNFLLEYGPEQVLSMYLDQSIYETEMGRFLKAYNLSDEAFIEDLEWVVRQLNTAIYKRIQTPPILKVSTLGFSPEAQLPLFTTDQYNRLKEKILN